MHGADPNWGRIVAAAGRSGVHFDINRVTVHVGGILLFENGLPHDEASPLAGEYLKNADVRIDVSLGTGGGAGATIWTCDLERRVRANQRGVPLVIDAAPPVAFAKDFLSILDLTPVDLDRLLTIAAQMKAERRLGRQTTPALAGPARGAALREAVAADAVHLRDRHP